MLEIKVPSKYEKVNVIGDQQVREAATATAKSLQSCPTLCNPIDVAYQAPLSMDFCRQEYWSG